MKMSIDTECPYCKHNNRLTMRQISNTSPARTIAFCDPDGGGCDRYYVVFWHIQVSTKCQKIDGQEAVARLKSA